MWVSGLPVVVCCTKRNVLEKTLRLALVFEGQHESLDRIVETGAEGGRATLGL